jgi:hypothetical protein
MSRFAPLLTVLVVGLLVTAGFAPVGAAANYDDVAVSGEPNIYAYLPYNVLVPGEETTLTVEVLNAGEVDRVYTNASKKITVAQRERFEDRVTTAQQVRVALRETRGVPVEVRTGSVPLGDIFNGEVAVAEFVVKVPEDAEPGRYVLAFRYALEYDEELAANGTVLDHDFAVRTIGLEVVIEERARFAVTATSADVNPGGRGEIRLDVVNRGAEVARDATLLVRAEGGDLSLEGGETDGRFLGTLRPGDSASVSYRVSLANDARPGSYPLEAVVVYTDDSGARVESRPIGVGVVPGTEQRFSLSNVFSQLRAGEEGTLSGTLTNNGPNAAVDAVVRLAVASDALDPQETEFPLGTLRSGESAEFAFPIDVRDGAESGPRPGTLVVVYRDAAEDRRTSEELDLVLTVGERRDVFSVRPVNATVPAGGSAVVNLSVTNNGDEPVYDINAKLFASDPLSADDDAAFLTGLDPGETATVQFTVSASNAAALKQYPVTVDFLYDTPDGETKLSETYQVGVTVVESERAGFTIAPLQLGAGLVFLLALVAIYYIRRRGLGPGGDDEDDEFERDWDPDVA